MRLIDVRIRNLCQFEDLFIEFSAGLNALIGPNGTGKSNALKLCYASFTGDFSRNSGVKKDNIRIGTPDGEPAFVTTRFEQGGDVYSLTRDVRNDKQTLVCPDGTKITRDASIDEKLVKVLGVNSTILNDYVFVDQWCLFDFLEVTPAKRAEAFSKLFGTQDMEKIYTMLGKRVLSDVSGFSPEVVGKAEAELLSAESALNRLRLAEEELLAYSSGMTGPYQAAKSLIEAGTKRTDLVRRLGESKVNIGKMQAESARLSDCISETEQDHSYLDSTIKSCGEAVSQAEEVQRRWKEVERANAARSAVMTQLSSVQQQVMEPEPARPEPYIPDLDVAFLNELEAQRITSAEYSRFLGTFNGHTVECPTCHTPVQSLLPSIDFARRELPGLQKAIQEKTEALQRSKKFDADQAAYLRRREANKQREKDLQDRLKELQMVSPPDMTAQEAADLLQNYKEAQADLLACVRHLTGYRSQLAQCQGGLKHLQESAAACERELLALPPEEDLADAYALVVEYDTKSKEYSELRGRIAGQQELVTQAVTHLQWIKDESAKLSKMRDYQERLKRLRDILHRDNLPRLIAKSRLQEMERATNRMLECFSSPFLVQAREDLSFAANHPDGRSQSASRLSGGEKMVLAVSFRVCVNLEFAKEVGLLCLDEPTVGLDSFNIGCLRTALSRLKEICAARGLQVIIITHEAELGPLFDKVVDLSRLRDTNDQGLKGSLDS